MEKDILSISKFLTIISLIAVFILSLVFLIKHFPISELLTLDLSLVIAGIPIALPTVMAVILSIGASGLAKKKVIVRKLSALEELSNVNLLLTDKTGTLTNNEIKIVNIISYNKNFSKDDIISLANYGASTNTPDAIEQAIINKYNTLKNKPKKFPIIKRLPYDAMRKRSTTLIKRTKDNLLVSLGAPQVISSLSKQANIKKQFKQDVILAAKGGYRVLALAIKPSRDIKEANLEVIGLLFLADPLDKSAKSTLRFIHDNGIDVKMLTGDNHLIAQRITDELGFVGDTIYGKDISEILKSRKFKQQLTGVAAFAEILPQDKHDITERAGRSYTVAVTGDGINDLPALRAANVGIAVSGSVNALKSMADIVLLDRGLSVIKTAILESRKVFVRLYNYSVYRISESFRLIISILVLGIWYGYYPLVPLQLIVLALLNDVPIISLAVDRVKTIKKPMSVNIKERLGLSLLFGFIGVINSLIFFTLLNKVFFLPLEQIQTMFFLKLTISGHALIFVAHTKDRWFKFLPSKQVIMATVGTQLIATLLAATGFLMPSKISWTAIGLTWIWVLLWMQVSELMKDLEQKIIK